MDKEKKEIMVLKSKQVLLMLSGLARPFSLERRASKKSFERFLDDHIVERQQLFDRIRYLEKKNLVKRFVKDKKYYFELTPKGKKQATKFTLDLVKIERPTIWDKKWRVVFYDIPKKYNTERDIFRNKIVELGFRRTSESCYCYPFECAEQLRQIANFLGVNKYCSIMVADIMLGEVNIVLDMMAKGVLTKDDLKTWKPKAKY